MIPAVKICGITRVGDAEAAIAAGAGYIGLIFAEDSPRCISLEAAKEIARTVRGRVKIVTVFKDSPADRILDFVSHVEPDLVQYHGCEPADRIAALTLPAIKAFQLDGNFSWDTVRPYSQAVKYILIDRKKNDSTPDWLATAAGIVSSAPAGTPPLFLAGGLTPANVGAVVSRLKGMQLHALDVASGVEQEPGLKDASKMQDFCRTVREASTECLL